MGELPESDLTTEESPVPAAAIPYNPLSDICQRLGINTRSAGRLLFPYLGPGSTGHAHAALENPPTSKALIAFLKLMEEIGAEIRLRRAEPLYAWINADYLDKFYFDNPWRLDHQYPELPANHRELRRYIMRLRSGRKHSFGVIKSKLIRGHICTATGLCDWRRSTVKQVVDSHHKKFPDDKEPLKPRGSAIGRWRAMMVSRIFSDVYDAGLDPFFKVRYGLVSKYHKGRIWMRTENVITEPPKRWFAQAMSKVLWIGGQWGLAEPADWPFAETSPPQVAESAISAPG